MTEQEIEAILERFSDIVARKIANELSTTWLTREEYSHRFKISLRSVDNLIAAGKLETKKRGRRIYLANMDAWQVSDANRTEGARDGDFATTGKRNKSRSGSGL